MDARVPPQSDLAGEVLKDPYHFDFLTLADDAHEREMQRGLLAHIRQFLELGAGFAFVGENVHFEVGGEGFYVDLLFYHLKLRAFVICRPSLQVLEDRILLSFITASSYPAGYNPRSVAVADFNRDGILDLAVTNESSGTVSILLGQSDGSYSAAKTYRVGSDPVSIATTDFNRDGIPDVAVAIYIVGSGPSSVTVGDFDADGKLDLCVVVGQAAFR
jgi:hypothetical protein